MSLLSERLSELRDRGLYRRTRLVSGPQGPRVIVDGRPALLLCSNNYLGLADHPRVREAAADAAMRWGVGAGGSRLVSGTMTVHRRLEERLAEFEGTESALLFGSGYLANTGVIAALAQAGGVVLSDELNHASLIDGCKLAGAETVVYKHADLDHLEWAMEKAAGRPAVIVTDSVFSMDGDVAPLEGIVEIAQRLGARTIVDEAHATGVLGPGGRGAVAAAGLTGEVDVVVGTLGKALGSYGAYAACSAEMSDWLTNKARTLIFSTAPPPPAIAGAMEALAIIEEEPKRVERLAANSKVMREALRAEGFDIEDEPTPIIPLIVGSAANAVDLCEEALARGLYAQAIRPPTVPEGTARLRISVMATHTAAELKAAAATITRACEHSGLRAARPEERGRNVPAGDNRAPGDDGQPIRASRGPKLFDLEVEAPTDFRRAA
ncbi:MAG: 8-amino-7-oxononanoate synthase [Solirubrobacterales bacterium]|nr:8-amino-7-oxononanoate synthase [Solirubrobacterales bacterium]